MHGGVEDYFGTAARAMADRSIFVVVFDSRQRERVEEAASGSGLAIVRWVSVIPREAKDSLFSLFAMQKRKASGPDQEISKENDLDLVIRDRDGKWPPVYREARSMIGFPPGYWARTRSRIFFT